MPMVTRSLIPLLMTLRRNTSTRPGWASTATTVPSFPTSRPPRSVKYPMLAPTSTKTSPGRRVWCSQPVTWDSHSPSSNSHGASRASRASTVILAPQRVATRARWSPR